MSDTKPIAQGGGSFASSHSTPTNPLNINLSYISPLRYKKEGAAKLLVACHSNTISLLNDVLYINFFECSQFFSSCHHDLCPRKISPFYLLS